MDKKADNGMSWRLECHPQTVFKAPTKVKDKDKPKAIDIMMEKLKKWVGGDGGSGRQGKHIRLGRPAEAADCM